MAVRNFRRGAGPAAQGLSELLPAGLLGAGGAEATLGSQMLRLRAALPLAPLEWIRNHRAESA